MVRAFFVALVLALGTNAEPGPTPAEPAPTPVPRHVLAVFFPELDHGSDLARVDPLTLKPSARPLRLAGGSAWMTSLSPDRKQLALSGGLGMASVELVDVRRMRSLGVVNLRMGGDLRFLSWEEHLVAVVDEFKRRAVVIVDPRSRTVLARHSVDGTILQVERGGPGQVVLLLGPRDGIGELRLAVVGGKSMTVTSLPKLSGGSSVQRDGDDVHAREVIPALVVDRAGRRAFVYEEGAVVEVSLANSSATFHALSKPVSILQRFRNWLEPEAQAKLVEGSYRNGKWIGDGRFAVSGTDFAKEGNTPAGLAIVDTETWTLRKVADTASEVAVNDDTLLTFGTDEGIRGYDLAGNERFHLLRRESAWVQVAGGLAYAQIGEGERIAVIDTATGRVLDRAKVDQPVTLVDDPPTLLE